MTRDKAEFLFSYALHLVRGSRVERLRKAPAKLLWTKLIEIFCLVTGRTTDFRAKTFWGHEMNLVFPEVVSMTIARYGFFEEGLTCGFIRYLKSGMTVIDIGAHFGYFSLLASALVGDEGEIHSFEPTPSTYRMLCANTVQFRNIYIINKAVYSKTTKLSFTDLGARYSAFNSSGVSRINDKEIFRKTRSKSFDIDALSIDEYVHEKKIYPDFIKIDAEGAESAIFHGMVNTIYQARPIISLEVGDINHNHTPTSRELVDHLTSLDYIPYEYFNGEFIEHIPKNYYSYDNLVFLPKEKIEIQ